jgi:hypothetical protein
LPAQNETATAQAFARIKTAIETTDFSAVQARRVRGHFSGYGRGGEWVGAVETMVHRGSVGEERFALELRGFEGMSLSPPELAQRQVLYQTRAAYLVRYQSFRVHDARQAARHYALQALGDGSRRAGRPCSRVAVISRTPDRPSWLLDLDAATGLPLYCGEFTPEGRLVAEVEVSHIACGAAAQIPPGDGWAWAPRMGIEEFASAAQASARASSVASLVLGPEHIGGDYTFDHARVMTEPLTGEQTLVHVFHDGIDALFVSQRTRTPLQTAGHTIRSYSEAGVYQYLFQQHRTEFLIVGRNANLHLVATRVYRMAVACL